MLIKESQYTKALKLQRKEINLKITIRATITINTIQHKINLTLSRFTLIIVQ
jgi:hypothetical protein